MLSFLRIPLLGNKAAFREFIANPIEKGNYNGIRNLQAVLQAVCIRRTKIILGILDPVVIQHSVQLSDQEKHEYHKTGEDARQLIEDVVCGRSTMKQYHVVLQTITKLRLFCNHGTISSSSEAREDQQQQQDEVIDEESRFNQLQQQGDDTCENCACDVLSVTFSEGGDLSGGFTLCGHLLCADCLSEYLEAARSSGKKKTGFKCTVCSKVMTLPQESKSTNNLASHHLNCDGHSSKLSSLIDDIQHYRHSDKRFSIVLL